MPAGGGARRRRLAEVAVLALAPPLLCLPLLLGLVTADPEIWTSHLAFAQPGADLLLRGYPGWADLNAGVTTEALGGLAASDWLHGRIPWWNPYSGVGLPLAAEQQNSALFLPFVLLLACANGVLLLKIALQIVTGFASFGLLRTIGFDRTVALLCALLAEFNGTFAWYSHGPIMPVAFLPVLLWGIERCRIAAVGSTPGWGAPIVALAVAMSLLAGFPETAYLDGLLGLVWFAARLATMPGRRAATRFAISVVAGGVCGLLLASPGPAAVLLSLPGASLSAHVDSVAQHLLRPNLLMLVLPYAYGPILFGSEQGGDSPDIWWHAGGFIGLPVASAALLAVISALRRTDVADRSLRCALAIFLCATAAKAIGWGPAVAAFNTLPFVRQSMFYVYVLPSWEIASIVLAAYGLADARAGRLDTRTVWIGAAGVAAAVALALRMAWPWLANEASHVHGTIAAAWVPSAVECLLAAVLLATRARTSMALAALLAAAIIDFAYPLLSAARPRPLDMAPVQWLRSHLGDGRFYSEYLLQPNTAARYGVASVNHIYLPVPRVWVDYLHQNLNPSMDGVTFFGNDLRATEGGPTQLAGVMHPPATIAHAIAVLENLSVRYVVVPHGVDPFEDTLGADLDLTASAPLPLTGPTIATGIIASSNLRGQNVTQIGLQLGTYRGHAEGVVVARICTQAACATASTDAAGAADNALAWMTLDHPLPVEAEGAVTLAVHAEGPANRPALWQAPCADHRCRASPVAILRFRPIVEAAVPAYADRLVDIFPLPAPAPYVSAVAGHCRLEPRSRDRIDADCAAPDTLVRRELFMPGWQVRVGGRRVAVAETGAIFQSVRLPAGRSVVAFRYRPPGETLIGGGLFLGATLLVGLCVLGRRRS